MVSHVSGRVPWRDEEEEEAERTEGHVGVLFLDAVAVVLAEELWSSTSKRGSVGSSCAGVWVINTSSTEATDEAGGKREGRRKGVG